MSVYLIALCVFDSLLLFLSIFILLLPAAEIFLEGTSVLVNYISLINVYTIRFLYPLLMAANYASIWTITTICIQRYFAVCHPFGNFRMMGIKQSRIIIIVISLVALAANSCRYLEYNISPANNDSFLPSLYKTDLARNYTYIMVSTVFYTLVVYIIPFISLSVLNIIIIRAIYQSTRLAGALTHQERREHRSTFMILAVIVSFFLCNTLTIVIRWIDILDPEGSRLPSRWLLSDFSNFLVNVNSTGNPFIYFICTRRFKDMYLEIRNTARRRSADGRRSLLSRTKTTGFSSARNSPRLSIDSNMNTYPIRRRPNSFARCDSPLLNSPLLKNNSPAWTEKSSLLKRRRGPDGIEPNGTEKEMSKSAELLSVPFQEESLRISEV